MKVSSTENGIIFGNIGEYRCIKKASWSDIVSCVHPGFVFQHYGSLFLSQWTEIFSEQDRQMFSL